MILFSAVDSAELELCGQLDDIAIDDDEEIRLETLYNRINYVFMCHNKFLVINSKFKLNLPFESKIAFPTKVTRRK